MQEIFAGTNAEQFEASRSGPESGLDLQVLNGTERLVEWGILRVVTHTSEHGEGLWIQVSSWTCYQSVRMNAKSLNTKPATDGSGLALYGWECT